jgi:hypothetical protein
MCRPQRPLLTSECDKKKDIASNHILAKNKEKLEFPSIIYFDAPPITTTTMVDSMMCVSVWTFGTSQCAMGSTTHEHEPNRILSLGMLTDVLFFSPRMDMYCNQSSACQWARRTLKEVNS